ncbi:uncharacterized protein LOC110265048 [Arachis ipaensis]|uniref:uncharacterized protein LOC110265048 n=1 Tax=Arachis ipaensis TaxID=130454 RepID=UPI000A2B0D83|nr:uncharacterized protein LOC110265048 [Arachis ipaensis]
MNLDKALVVRNLDIEFVKDLILQGEGWNMDKLKLYFDATSVDKILRTPEPKTTEHALLLCPWTRAAWFGAQIQCCPTALTVSSFRKWMMELLGKMRLNAGANYDLCSSKVGFLVWEVWKARNLAIYQKTNPNPIMVICKAKLTRSGSRVTWRPPLQGWIKCNVDVAFVGAQSVGATAVVFRDHNGTLLSGINSTIIAASPLAAEALAKVIIESDNQILIQALKSHASIAEIQVVLDDILHLARGIPNYGFTWMPREANSLAHEVVKLTGQGTLHQT